MLKNKWAIITGSTGGIGSKISETLYLNKANIVILGRSDKKLKSLKEKLIKKKIGKIILYKIDLSSEEEIKKFAIFIKSKIKKIDILVNNAGVLLENYLGMISKKIINNTTDVNLLSAIYLVQYLKNIMGRGSSIINISSIMGIKGNVGQSIYSASKAGLIGFTYSAAKELGNVGIRVNAVAPGLIKTRMIKAIPIGKKEELLKNIYLKRIGYPQDVANLVLFLSSDLSTYISGQTIGIDGCMTI